MSQEFTVFISVLRPFIQKDFQCNQMGVKGLESYMEERKGKLCYPVNINEEIEKFKKGLTGSSKPEVLVDAQCTLRLLNKGLDWICGGQYIDCGKKIKSFVEAIREAGAEPIFFYDGPCLDQKRNEWIKRRVRYYTEIQKLMNKIRTRNSVAEKEPFMIPTGQYSHWANILKNALS